MANLDEGGPKIEGVPSFFGGTSNPGWNHVFKYEMRFSKSVAVVSDIGV